MNSAKNIYADVNYLTENIGVRLAGSENERKAAEYMKRRLLDYVPECTIEEFPIMQRCIENEELEILLDGEWIKFATCMYNPSPTTNGKVIEAELVYFDAHTGYQREDLSFLNGKAVLHYGSFPSTDAYRRLMEAKPLFLLMTDTRYTSHKCIANGFSTSLINKYGVVPTSNIAFFDALKICSHKSTRARLCVSGEICSGTSCNVIATLPGTEKDADIIYCGAHIDSVAGSVGADDNASGCGIILELARILAQKEHKNTIKFIAFGTEEQLSVGSAAYVRVHRTEVEKKGRFMCNFDSCASATGWFKFVINADKELRDTIAQIYNTEDVYYEESLAPDPYNDLFSFTAAGVPGITHMRNNCQAGRFYHHQPDNNLNVISCDIASKLAEVSSKLLEKIADTENQESFTTNPDVKETVENLWKTTYGGWNL